jgi:hypothetical protein
MAKPIYLIGGSKGGVGKSLVTLWIINRQRDRLELHPGFPQGVPGRAT